MKEQAPSKKHPCPDCHFCQWCSNDRCRLCLKKELPKKRLSLAEQLVLYDQINAELFGRNPEDA